MKKLLLIIKTELNNKALLFFNIIIIIAIVSSILGFFGTIYGRQYESFHDKNYTISGSISTFDKTLFEVLEEFESSSRYYLSSQIDDTKYANYNIVYPSSNYNFQNDLHGDFDKEDHSIIIPYAYAIENDINIGDDITLFLKKFNVTGSIGMILDNNSFIVSKENFQKYAKNIEFIAIVSKDIDQNSFKIIVSTLSEYLDSGFYYSEFDKDTADYLKQFRLYAILLFIAAIINVIYVYSYIMNKRKQMLTTYRLVGASNHWVYAFIIIDALVVFSISYLIAVTITLLIYEYILVPNIPNTTFLLSMKDILSFYFIMLAIYSILIAIYIRRINKITITELTHKEGF